MIEFIVSTLNKLEKNEVINYHVKAVRSIGKHLKATPINIMVPVKIMAFRRPLVSSNHNTGTKGMIYMIFPQFPNKAMVALLHSGQNTVSKASDIGPKLFQIMP